VLESLRPHFLLVLEKFGANKVTARRAKEFSPGAWALGKLFWIIERRRCDTRVCVQTYHLGKNKFDNQVGYFRESLDHQRKQKVPPPYSRADDGALSLNGRRDDELKKTTLNRAKPL